MTGKDKKNIVFMFAGQGSQYVNMCLDLYEKTPFREYLDLCLEIAAPKLDEDLKQVLFPGDGTGKTEVRIKRIDIAQLVVFIVEYSLARLLMQWGIRPDAMIGYSFGEYIAACIAGVFTLPDALELVVQRGKLMSKTPRGRMLSVPLPEDRCRQLLNEELSLAIINGSSCVIAGSPAAVTSLEKQLTAGKYFPMPLDTGSAPHSRLMEPVLEDFKKEIRKIQLNEPIIPYISNVTGDWITPQQAIDPGFWAAHLCSTVQFSRGLETLIELPGALFIEIGPGRDLSILLKQYIHTNPKERIIDTIRHPKKEISDLDFLVAKVSHLAQSIEDPGVEAFEL